MLRRIMILLGTTGVAAALLTPGAAVGKSVGGCPQGGGAEFKLVTVESLGITPETATGIPSLDGNGDGLTCIKLLPNQPAGTFIFRDNTV